MSFFKSAKYKLGGNSSKNKTTVNTKAEVFQKIDNAPYYEVETTTKTKGKAPPKPADVALLPKENIKACFRISNKTSFLWKLKNQENNSLFPSQLASTESKLVHFTDKSDPAEATYILSKEDDKETDEKALEFIIKVAQNDDIYELVIDWQNLTDLAGIKFKPERTGSDEPIKLSSEEVLVEVEHRNE